MYCVRFTVVFLLCLPAIGCQTIPEAIPQAEAIVMEHPDSAVRLLQGIPAPAKNLSSDLAATMPATHSSRPRRGGSRAKT